MGTSWLLSLAGLAGSGAVVIGAWLLTYALHSTALLLAAWGVTSVRWVRWSPAARLTIWRAALVAGVLTSVAQVAAPAVSRGRVLRLTEAARGSVAAVQVLQRATVTAAPVSWIPATAATAAMAATPSVPGASATPDPLPPIARPASTAGAPHRAVEGTAVRVMVFTISRAAIAVAVWGIVALVLLARMGLARRRLMASLADRRDATASLAAGALRHLAALAGVRRPVALTTSDALPAPAAISSREIVLPSRALRDLSLAEQEGVLAHELAHVVRHDTRWLQLAAWIERLAWFQPLNRVARRQMQLHAEFAADAWAVRHTRQPLALARALAHVAGWVTAHPAGDRHGRAGAAATAGADGSPLVERVRRLTAPRRDRGRAHRLGGRWAVAVMAGAASLALAFLPRIDAGGPSRAAAHFSNDERFDLRLVESPLRAERRPDEGGARWSDTKVRLVRVGDPLVRLVPAPGLPALPRRVLVIARQVS